MYLLNVYCVVGTQDLGIQKCNEDVVPTLGSYLVLYNFELIF